MPSYTNYFADVSLNGDGSVMTWTNDDDGDLNYEIYIGLQMEY